MLITEGKPVTQGKDIANPRNNNKSLFPSLRD